MEQKTYKLLDKVKLIELKQHENLLVKTLMVHNRYLEKLQKFSLRAFNNELLDLILRAESV